MNIKLPVVDTIVMAEPVQDILDQFQLSRVPVLPELLIKGLSLQGKSWSLKDSLVSTKVLEYLQENPLLQLQLQAELTNSSGVLLSPKALLQESGENKLFGLIRDNLQWYNPHSLRKQREVFHYLHWRQSLLCGHIAAALSEHCGLPKAEEMGTLGQIHNLGELILDNMYGLEYLKLHTKTSSERELCNLEKQNFGTTHAELGARYLKRLGIDGFYADAVRFHHESKDAILDASVEVKLLWLANQMSGKEGVDFDLIQSGQQLFNFEQEVLRAIHQSALERTAENLKKYEITVSTGKRLPLADQSFSSKSMAIKSKLMEEIQGANRFNKILHTAAVSQNYPLLEVLRATGDQLFDGKGVLVFKKDEKDESIFVVGYTLSEHQKVDFQLKLSDQPSLIANSFITARPIVFNDKQEEIKVADQQILSFLNSSALICDPVVFQGKVQALIVFGASYSAGLEFLANNTQRNALHKLWLEQEGLLAVSKTNNREFYYQQKIREAVHEINNPLSIIKNYLQLLNLKQEHEPEVQEEIKVIETEIERIKQILIRLDKQEESTSSDDKESLIDLNKIITNIYKVFSASISKDKSINVSLDLAPDLVSISGKENALKQVLINLLKNAVEACVDEGNIIIETHARIVFNQSNYVLINIIDDGPGISANIMQNLFKPGATSKGDGHSGSGLPIVKSFMDEIGGLVSCQSGQGGTTFALYFPSPKESLIEDEPDNSGREDEKPNNKSNKVYDFKR